MLKFCSITAFLLALLFSFANCYLYDWPTGDEIWHFSYSKRILDQGEIDRESVHNYNSTTPFVVINAFLDEAATKLGVTQSFDKVVVRLPAVGWYILLLILSYLTPRCLFRDCGSEKASSIAMWTALLVCLDETLLGHGSHIGSDMPFAAMTLLFLVALDNYRRAPHWKAAFGLATVLGITFNVKYFATFLLLFASICVPLFFFRACRQQSIRLSRALLFLIGQAIASIIIMSLIIDTAYGFHAIGLSFSNKEWYSGVFKSIAQLIPNLPLPWPLPFVAGFDHQFAAERTWSWNSIILGAENPNGVWYYFPLVWILKTPLASIAITIIGVVLALPQLRELKKVAPLSLTFWLFTFLFSYFCFVFRTQVGIRYVLMCLPLAHILLSYVLTTSLKSREQHFVAVFLLLGSLYEAVPYFGNNLAFTNSILLDKSKTYQWIADSNIDWFQNYTHARAEATSKIGSYSLNPPHLQPGNNLISINKLTGVMRNFPQYRWIREHMTPTGNFGKTLIFFHATTELFERFLKEERTYSTPGGVETICSFNRNYQPLSNGESAVFDGTWQDPKLFTACLKVTEPAQIQLTVERGYGAFGSYPAELNCVGDEAGAGESVWFNLSTGIHPICARIMASAQARWTIHRGKVALAFRTE